MDKFFCWCGKVIKKGCESYFEVTRDRKNILNCCIQTPDLDAAVIWLPILFLLVTTCKILFNVFMSNWDMLDAIVYLENQGKIKGPNMSSYSTRAQNSQKISVIHKYFTSFFNRRQSPILKWRPNVFFL